MPGLKLASRYALNVFAQRNFGALRALKYHDEIFLIIQLIVERHFLHVYDATFSEHLYGLERTSRQKTQSRLTPKQRRISLLLMILIPYLKNKLDSLYTKWSTSPPTPTTRTGTYQKIIKNIYTKIWPYCSATYEGANFFYILWYLLKDAPYSSPLLHAQKLVLSRVSAETAILRRREVLVERLRTLYTLRTGSSSTIMRVIGSFVAGLFSAGYILSDYSTHLLLLGAFSFKFLEWWYSSENYLNKNAVAVRIPPPPKAPKQGSNPGSIELPLDVEQCPLCRNPRVNPTLLSVSGYVFCYSCIHEHVSKYHTCPRTSLPVTLDHLRRIFEQS
ncbi:peroxin [Acrasis kona]|uniref:Peroxisome assembly protein 12 n=1 Tax=Acrasis kona TaxID=1008807 RepID=A0AAW2ZE88_9EUKA